MLIWCYVITPGSLSQAPLLFVFCALPRPRSLSRALSLSLSHTHAHNHHLAISAQSSKFALLSLSHTHTHTLSLPRFLCKVIEIRTAGLERSRNELAPGTLLNINAPDSLEFREKIC